MEEMKNSKQILDDITNLIGTARLIDANALLEKLKGTNRYFTVKFDIEEMPTAYDLALVVKQVNEISMRIFHYCEEIDLELPENEKTGYDMLNDILLLREIVSEGGVDPERLVWNEANCENDGKSNDSPD